MKIQLALDRLSVSGAIQLIKMVEDYIDWIEVGTSLIKEYGMSSVQKIKKTFPSKKIVADIKTIDNAVYESQICFRAGADIATVMGVAPDITIDAFIQEAESLNKMVMIDLLNTSEDRKKELLKYHKAIFCMHVSKDEQELDGRNSTKQSFKSSLQSFDVTIAVAGGLSIGSLDELVNQNIDIAIIGTAITKAKDPRKVAKQFYDEIRKRRLSLDEQE
ncbi:3-hexulose-6-phosphate synthase [Bacillus sp. 03113]|uniref:3-hexulose-6-phosphate synthase n=1 Tax=Bacillus sp. 03113 TaxID=2578211 RepID=UPI001144E69D|nr:3-hexulose-6-phosphate synthase [Bacillus sp. 03113]